MINDRRWKYDFLSIVVIQMSGMISSFCYVATCSEYDIAEIGVSISTMKWMIKIVILIHVSVWVLYFSYGNQFSMNGSWIRIFIFILPIWNCGSLF